jgi:hypothetical protein
MVSPIQSQSNKPRGAKPFTTGNRSKLLRLPGLLRERKRQGLSRQKLYERSGVAPRTQQLAEEGHKVRAKTVIKLARGLGCDPIDLMH